MQEVALYYRRYRRCSCTTANAANAAVPKFGTGTSVFKCICPIDASYRNDSTCRKYRRYRRYSCTTGNAANAAVPKFGTGTAVFKYIKYII